MVKESPHDQRATRSRVERAIAPGAADRQVPGTGRRGEGVPGRWPADTAARARGDQGSVRDLAADGQSFPVRDRDRDA